MQISELGEFNLIKRLTESVKLHNASSAKGIGDDCAVMNYGEKQVLATTDVLLEGIHFDLTYTPLKHLGYKSAVVNFSDIYAMNGQPKQLLVTIGISKRFEVEQIEELYSGLLLACSKYKVDLVGGDTSASLTGLTISITCLGEGENGKTVYRNGARQTDLICVSGNLGASYMGLQLLEREKRVFCQVKDPDFQPDFATKEYLLERQLKPEARTDIRGILTELGIKPTSMIDISDGLASEVLHLSDQSKVGFRVYEEKIPMDEQTISTAEEFNLNPVMTALSGGEDYELLFTIAQEDYDKIKNHPDFTIIGHAVELEQGNHLVLRGSNELAALTAQGWDAFLKNKQK